MTTFLTTIHILACFFLIISVLLQQGKGADVSASLGGSSQTLFGSSGGATFFTRFTSIVAGAFMATSIFLTVIHNQGKKSIFDNAAAKSQSSAPVNPVSAPAQSAPAVPVPAQPATPDKK